MSTRYLDLARQTQQFTFDRLAYLGSARSCRQAAFVSYLRSDDEPQWADQWYITSQIGADAALLSADPNFDRCSLDKAARFLDRLFEPETGGYLARGSPDGRQVLKPDKYCDDHGHFGLMLIDAYEATGDQQFLERARRAADYLIRGGVWDDTFAGGFWWNSRLGDSIEGKPAQTNGLAVDLFAQLYGLTGQRHYLDWSLRTLDWLERRLFDPDVMLYRWSVHFHDLTRRRGEVRSERLFNYDQGILIEALVSLHRHHGAGGGYLERARALAEQLEPAFWHRGEGGFNLEAGVEQVFAIYSSWLTPSLLALSSVDPDERWPDLARRNADAMRSYLATPTGGYYRGALVRDGVWSVEPIFDTAANAGLQRAFAALALVAAERPL